MAVFLIIAPTASAPLDVAVKKAFPDNYFVVAEGQYLVADSTATTQEVFEKLGAPGGGVGRVLITPVQNYTGWHNKDIWEWIASRASGAAPPSTKNG